MSKLIISILLILTSFIVNSCGAAETEVSEEQKAEQLLQDNEKKLQEIMNESEKEH